ncbi:hypothetical protein DFH29DRAFT_931871 [Suillus ampliporus]|nr:hypothetical protein DFH29DRAFT_931871 [Suillus ampliporus]
MRGFARTCANAIREALDSEALIIAAILASITIWGPPLLLWRLMKVVIFSYIPAFMTRLSSLARQSLPKVEDAEANAALAVSDITSRHILPLNIPDAPAASLDAPAVKWLLDTSTDPEVFLAAASLVPEIEWPLNLDISDILYQLRNTFMTCFDIQDQLVSRSEERAIICATALNHIYCENLPRSGPQELFDVGPERERFKRLWKGIEPRDTNLSMVSLLGLGRRVFGDDSVVRLLGQLRRCESDIPLAWLSHILPYCILLEEGVTPELADLGTYVIDKLLSSAPSGQIIANCALLACQMLGYKFERKALARVDKSNAARQISTILAVQFQRLLCAKDVEKRCHPHRFLENTLLGHQFRRIVLDLFHLAPYDARVLKREFIARNLDYCREVYEQARLEDSQASNWDSDIRSILRFVIAAGCQGQIQLDQPDSVWSGHFSWDGDTRSFEDFSWLVDYLDSLRNSDDDDVVTYILLVLSGMRRLGSPTETERHLAYVKSLAFFMNVEHPRHIRHAALRAAHDARSALASIRTSLQDRVPPRMTMNPPAGEEFFNARRDLCFLRLVFALARNPDWQHSLVSNDCVQRCVAIIEPSLRCYLHPFYLVGFFFRIAPSEPMITEEQWCQLTKEAWHAAATTNVLLVDDDGIAVLPALVESSRKHLTGGRASKDYLKQMDHHVASALKMLERRMQSHGDPSQEKTFTQDVILLVQGLKSVVHEVLEQR